ncbi:MAG TPA: hypothetical protein VGJ78_03205 [Vicinamibacterales bacterium]
MADSPRPLPTARRVRELRPGDELGIWTLGPTPDQFEKLAATNSKWRAVAGHLFAAAEKLWPEIEAAFVIHADDPDDATAAEGLRLRGPCYLLIGLAFENLAKAVVVARKNRQNQPITNGEVLYFGSKHDVLRFVSDAGVPLQDLDVELLTQLGRFVEWQGRYPVPRRGRRLGHNTVTGTSDMRRFKNLFARLESEYLRVIATPANG